MSAALINMAKEYRENAAPLKERVDELKRLLKRTKNKPEQMQLQTRILNLESIYRDNMSTAKYLENYHKRP